MASSRPELLVPLFLLCILPICTAGILVGFSYDARRNNRANSTIETISFLKKSKVTSSQIHVFAADHKVLDALSNTEVPLCLYLDEPLIKHLSKSEASTTSWLKNYVPYSQINTTSIIVSCSSCNSDVKQLSLLLSTLHRIHSALKSFNLDRQVEVAVALSLPGLENLEKRPRQLHQLVELLRNYGSYILVETEINGEVSMGDHFIDLVIETAKSVATALHYSGVPVVLHVKNSAFPSAVEVAAFTEKLTRSIETQTEIISKISGILAEVSPMKESLEKLKTEEGKIFHSSQGELLDEIKQSVPPAKTYTHDAMYPPTTIFSPIPISNPVTTPATIPYMNPPPAIVTVPYGNPIPVTPTNPATTPFTGPPVVTGPPNTPITVPTINPYNPPMTVPTTTPITNPGTNDPFPPPGSIPVMTPVTPITNPVTPPITPITNPVIPPVTINTPTGLGQTWCVAKTEASESALQAALDYACGAGGADCSAIQQTGTCYDPNSLQSHASYAFNSYYQKNPVPSSCDFGGTATIVSTNPSTGSCIYPSYSSSSSTSASSNMPSSVLNTSNPATGTTTIFGSQLPPNSSTSVSFTANLRPMFHTIVLAASFVTGRLVICM